MIMLLLLCSASLVACVLLAWGAMVAVFPGTDVETATGVILLSALAGLLIGVAAWWQLRRRKRDAAAQLR